jgi:nucleotide-binding universal stress UspA family protein
MPEKTKASLVVPVDGSDNSKKALKYLSHLYGTNDTVSITLCYILPEIPPLLADADLENELFMNIKEIKDKNIQMAKRILNEGKAYLEDWGFASEQVQTVYKSLDRGVARDICRVTTERKTDAIVLATLGRSRLEAFFMGQVSHDVLEYSRNMPVWLVNGSVLENNVLIGIDPSDNSLNAVRHACLMLSGTDCHITLFHTYRHLRRFLPKEVLEASASSELEKIWYQMAGKEVAPYMKKAMEMLIDAGFKENRIFSKVIDGTRSAAADILDEARNNKCGTVILGRWGASHDNELKMGSVTRKVIHDSKGMAVWVV